MAAAGQQPHGWEEMLESDPFRQVARMLWSLLPYLPLGLLAGLLSGVLGIGGGLVFSPYCC